MEIKPNYDDNEVTTSVIDILLSFSAVDFELQRLNTFLDYSILVDRQRIGIRQLNLGNLEGIEDSKKFSGLVITYVFS